MRLYAPVLIMTSHDYSNIVAFNANTGEFITVRLLDLRYRQKHLDFPNLQKQNEIQFRSVITVKTNIHPCTFTSEQTVFVHLMHREIIKSQWQMDIVQNPSLRHLIAAQTLDGN